MMLLPSTNLANRDSMFTKHVAEQVESFRGVPKALYTIELVVKFFHAVTVTLGIAGPCPEYDRRQVAPHSMLDL